MKIACIDRTASLRLTLLDRVEQAIESARTTFGHLSLGTAVPATLDDLSFGDSPEIAILGSGFSIDEVVQQNRALSRKHPRTARIAILDAESLSLEVLHRLEPPLQDYITTADPLCRLVHILYQQLLRSAPRAPGKLLTLTGAKGGVGVTSMTAALAHAFAAIGKTALIVDLSAHGALLQYSLLAHWRSQELAVLLKQRQLPRLEELDQFTITAPNGTRLLLTPGGGHDIRQLWLNSAEHLDIGLRLIELLVERYDIVLVDVGTVEGLLPFSLALRADYVVLTTSTEPAAVHLSHRALAQLHALPTAASFRLLINRVSRFGLLPSDLRASLGRHEAYSEELFAFPPVPYSAGGQYWMGTGNTLYTEGSKRLRETLDEIASSFWPMNIANRHSTLRLAFRRQPPPVSPPPKLLFELPQLAHESDTGGPISELSRVNGMRGSLQLEIILAAAAALIIMALALPTFLSSVSSLLARYS